MNRFIKLIIFFGLLVQLSQSTVLNAAGHSFSRRLASGASEAYSGNSRWNQWRANYLNSDFFELLTHSPKHFGALFKNLVEQKLNGQFFFGASSSHMQFEGGHDRV